MSPSELIVQARNGNVEAFLGLVRPFQPRLYRIGFAMTRNEQDAADVLQDTMLSAFRGLNGLHDPERVQPWLCRIASNHARMLLRTRRRHPEVCLDEIEGAFDPDGHRSDVVAAWPVSLDEEIDRRRIAARIAALAQGLPEDYLAIWTLADVERMSMADVAEVLELTLPNVKSRLHRARLALREMLGADLERSR